MDFAYIGMIVPWPLNFAPRDWAFCNGALLDVRSNTALFTILGTQYGGDGSTTFALPNLQGQLLQGTSTVEIPGETDGGTASTFPAVGSITNANLPPHQHPATVTLTDIKGTTNIQVGTANSGGQLVPSETSVLTGTPSGTQLAAAIYLPTGTPPTDPVHLGGVSTQIGGTGSATVGANTTTHSPVSVINTTTSVVAANSLTLNYIICVSGEFPTPN